MGMTDPVADMLTRIRNASMVKHETVEMPMSSLKADIARVLKDEGYIKSYKTVSNGSHPVLKMDLKYHNKSSVFEGLKRVSKPGCRVYVKGRNVPRVINGYGIAILSTSKGLMVDRDARKANIGGEVLCNIW